MNEPDNKSILIVEDEATLRELLVDTLTTLGYETEAASGGIEALEVLSHRTFDLLITDIKMPQLDGVGLLKKVRRRYPDLPVIFISGATDEEVIAGANPDGFRSKPFRISHLESLIKQTLERGRGHHFHGGRRVLLLEDDVSTREMMAGTLSANQFLPFAVSSDEDAYRELEHGRFDILIADSGENNPDRAAFVKRVKEERPDLPILLTTQTNPETTDDSAEDHLSADGYLNHPFSARQMITLLDELAPK
ncbi:MAG: response regulator [candidate division Zixibacteria bacterium]